MALWKVMRAATVILTCIPLNGQESLQPPADVPGDRVRVVCLFLFSMFFKCKEEVPVPVFHCTDSKNAENIIISFSGF